jgi:hypothetical protein
MMFHGPFGLGMVGDNPFGAVLGGSNSNVFASTLELAESFAGDF